MAIPVLMAFCVVGVAGNGAVVWLGSRRAKRHTLTLRLTVSLAANDLLMLVQVRENRTYCIG